MKGYLKGIAARIRGTSLLEYKLARSLKEIEAQKVLNGRTLSILNRQLGQNASISDYEFRVFSQYGDDGIIQHLIDSLGLTRELQTFIELGCSDYLESNTRFLLLNNNWSGLVVDADKSSIDQIKRDDICWRHDLTPVCSSITRENINELISSHNFAENVGLLSLDIDGNDYWVWQALEVIKPIILIVEYNSLFGDQHELTIPYNPSFDRTIAHFTHLYWGASIKALHSLGQTKGYSLIGSNSVGINLYFLRNDYLGKYCALSPKQAYFESKNRESRCKDGSFTFLRGTERLKAIKEMPLLNLATNSTQSIADIFF